MAGVTQEKAWFRKNRVCSSLKIESALPPKSPPPKNTEIPPPPLKRGILWAWRFSCRKNAIFPGAHQIGAAISGPRIAGKTFRGHEDFSDFTMLVTARVSRKTQDFHFLLQNPQTPEGFQEGLRRGLWRGLWRVLEGFEKGSAEDPSETLLKPFENSWETPSETPSLKPFWNPSGVRGFCSRKWKSWRDKTKKPRKK